MRHPQPSPVVLPDGRGYEPDTFLREFCWGHPAWSEDEASIAAFERLQKEWTLAIKVGRPPNFEDADYTRLLGVLRALQFPAAVSIELAHMRNQFVLAPRELPAPALDACLAS